VERYSHLVPPTVRISVRVKLRSSRSRILRADGLSIEASIASPPVDGAANAELIVLLASVLGVSKSALRLVQGETSKNKVVEVTNIDAADATERLARVVR
jgi:uncharacterized protein (TIGR00251 family)